MKVIEYFEVHEYMQNCKSSLYMSVLINFQIITSTIAGLVIKMIEKYVTSRNTICRKFILLYQILFLNSSLFI